MRYGKDFYVGNAVVTHKEYGKGHAYYVVAAFPVREGIFLSQETGILERKPPVKIIQLLMDDIKCCTERITKGYCSKDVDNIDI